jgi:hypothetical protein
MKTAILASDGQDNYYAIACADDDEATEALRDEIEARGWTVRGQVFQISIAGFRKLSNSS